MADPLSSIGEVVGLVDVIVRTIEHVKNVVHASKEIGDTVDRILISCQDVKRIAEEYKTCNFPSTVFSGVDDNLTLVCKIVKKCKQSTRRDRVKYVPKALSRLGKLENVEQQMRNVLAMITTIFTEKTWENTERTVALLEGQKDDMTHVLDRIDETWRAVQVEPTLQDSWVFNFSSVPSSPSHVVET
jgi:ABC-type transporter Mla MlaB component